MRKHPGLLMFFGSLALAAGCGDDSQPTFDAGLAVDQCLSSSDMEVILASRMDAGAGVDAGLPDPLHEAYYCALTPTCYALYFDEKNDEGLACVHDCLSTMPSAALSLGCLDCFAGEARTCAAANCLIQCIGDDPVACATCFEDFCQARLDACIGY